MTPSQQIAREIIRISLKRHFAFIGDGYDYESVNTHTLFGPMFYLETRRARNAQGKSFIKCRVQGIPVVWFDISQDVPDNVIGHMAAKIDPDVWLDKIKANTGLGREQDLYRDEVLATARRILLTQVAAQRPVEKEHRRM